MYRGDQAVLVAIFSAVATMVSPLRAPVAPSRLGPRTLVSMMKVSVFPSCLLHFPSPDLTVCHEYLGDGDETDVEYVLDGETEQSIARHDYLPGPHSSAAVRNGTRTIRIG